jgi:DNA-binding transcriptional LysR family regulator
MDHLNVRALQVFRTVMQAGSVSAAAQQLRITQPAVSKMLKTMEDAAGFELFKRHRGRLYPSQEAERLLLEADRLFGHFDALRDKIGGLRDARAGTLTVAAIPTLSGSLIAAAIGRFRETRPDVKVELRAHTSQQVVEAVTRQQVDLGFVHGSVDDPHVQADFMWETEMVCLMPRNHPLATLRAVKASHLVGQPLITLAQTSPPSWLIRENFAAAGVSPTPAVETNLTIGAYALVNAGAGIAIVDPLASLDDAFPKLVVRPFRPMVRIRTACLHTVFRPLSRLSMAFLETLRSMVAEIAISSGFIVPLTPDSSARAPSPLKPSLRLR